MTISFESNDIQGLKDQITAYALAHLGLRLQDTVGKHINLATKETLDNPKRKQGRQFGWRKKRGDVGPAIKTDTSSEVHAVEAPRFPDCEKKDQCKTMVAAVMGKFQDSLGRDGAFEKAKGCLNEFGVEHLDLLNPQAYNEFIEYCKKVIGAK